MPSKGKPASAKAGDDDGFTNPQGAPRGLLYLVALWKIAGKPMSGYQIMQEIEEKTEGAWRPGPGATYPILKKLEAQGCIKATKEEGQQGKAVYSITPTGRAKIAAAKKAFKSSGERLSLVGRIFSDLLEQEDLMRFAIRAPANSFQFVHEMINTNGHRMSHEDKLFLLREYSLLIERELRWSERALAELQVGPSEKPIAGEAMA